MAAAPSWLRVVLRRTGVMQLQAEAATEASPLRHPEPPLGHAPEYLPHL